MWSAQPALVALEVKALLALLDDDVTSGRELATYAVSPTNEGRRVFTQNTLTP